MWRYVDRVLTDVSEKRIAFIFKAEKSASGEPASARGCRLILSGKQLDTNFFVYNFLY
jgi:hypothetical protein